MTQEIGSLEFDSFAAFVEASLAPRINPFRTGSRDRHDSGIAYEIKRAGKKLIVGVEHFRGTKTFEDAVKLAREGWAEGLRHAESIRAQLKDRIQGSLAERQVVQWDVAGAGVDIGRYVTGEPENMIDFATEFVEAPQRFLRVAVNIGASSSVDKSEMIARGAAAAAMVDLLEASGIRVEVLAVKRSQGGEKVWGIDPKTGRAKKVDVRNGKFFNLSIVLKRVEEPLELDKIIFALAHPSMLRRLWLSVVESKRDIHVQLGEHYGYSENWNGQADVHVGALQSWNESALAQWVIGQLEAVGVGMC